MSELAGKGGLKILGWTVFVEGPDAGWIRHTDCPLGANTKTPDQDGPLSPGGICLKCSAHSPDKVKKMARLLRL